MAGETDLRRLLATMQPEVVPGEFVFVTVTDAIGATAAATLARASVHEDEGTTYVVARADAELHGWAYDFVAAWVTLRVHSALDAIGLTAAVATALADDGISANVLAGHHHDHVLVPLDRADDALAVLGRLTGGPSPP